MSASAAGHVVVARHGEAEVLQVRPMDVVPGPGQLLVRVEAAGVAMADVQMRAGTYPEPPALPFTPGYDVTGRIEAVGPGVDGFAPGDRVAALTVTGGYATHALAPASHAVAVPYGLDPVAVAALVLNWVTAAQMLRRVAAVHAGETVLVHGAAGGSAPPSPSWEPTGVSPCSASPAAGAPRLWPPLAVSPSTAAQTTSSTPPGCLPRRGAGDL